MTPEEKLLKSIFGPKPVIDPFSKVVDVPLTEFPDCCMVCAFGRSYYSMIECNVGPGKWGSHRAITEVCGHFERRV